MTELRFLPDGAVLEAETLVPPNDQIQQMESLEFQKMSSVCVTDYIEDCEKRGLRPIILVGCDIMNFNYIIIANDHERTE